MIILHKIYINANVKNWNKVTVFIYSNTGKYALIPQFYVHGTQMSQILFHRNPIFRKVILSNFNHTYTLFFHCLSSTRNHVNNMRGYKHLSSTRLNPKRNIKNEPCFYSDTTVGN